MTETYNKDLDFKILSENFLGKTFTKRFLHPFMKPYTIKTKNGFALNFRFTVSVITNLINYINNSLKNNKNFKTLFVDIKNKSLSDRNASNFHLVFFIQKNGSIVF